MDEISFIKEVRSSGSSLALYITRELNHIKVGKGDTVEVTIKKVTD